MAISLPDLVALRHRIESDITRLQEELQAAKLLERRIRAESSAVQPELELGDEPKTGTSFAEEVRKAVRTYTQDEFTVANVENFLKSHGVSVPAKNPRARIAMILQDLTKKGIVKITVKGSGNSPYRYRLLVESQNAGSEMGEGANARTFAPSVYNSPGGQPKLAALPSR